MKNALLSPTVRSVNMKNFLTENVRPHFIYSIEIQPHYSQSSRENATTSSGTLPLASCNEVPRPPGGDEVAAETGNEL